MAIQISSTTVINDSRRGIFASMNPGSYASASRPTSPATGDLIYNSTEGQLQIWKGSSWEPIG
jgi:hypothetical protein